VQVVYVKVDTAVVTLADGTPWTLMKGQHYPADDPVVKANRDKFSADPRYGVTWTGEPPAELSQPPDDLVEQATAAPGEKRGAVRRG
jgi:hypothetical protein